MRDKLGRFIKGSEGFAQKHSESSRKKMGKSQKELWQNPEHRKHMSEVHKGQKGWNEGLKGTYSLRHSGQFKKGQPSVFKGKKRPNISGVNNYAWKGGISSLYDRVKQSDEYKNWRRDVFIRDHYTCQDCGHRFIKIVAHHIKSFAEFKKLWFKVENGKTLCKSCHLKLHQKIKKMKGVKQNEKAN